VSKKGLSELGIVTDRRRAERGNRLPISPLVDLYNHRAAVCAVKVPTRWGYQGPRVLRGESDPEPDRSVACVIAGLAESFWTEDKASSQGPRQTVHATVI
jgi:hypothetical protein